MTLGRFLIVSLLCLGLSFQLTVAQPLSPDQARADLTFLKRKLDQLHPGVGYYTPQARMEQLYDSLYNQLTAPVDYLSFFHHISPLVTSIKDGHTNLNHRRNYIGKSTRYLPFFIRSVDDTYFISHNVSTDTTLRRGTELLTVNGRPVADIHAELMNADHSGSDGDNSTGRRQWSLVQFADYYASWYGWADSVTITYRLANNSLTRQTRLACPTLDAFRSTVRLRYRNEIDRQPNLSVRVIDTLTRTAVLRVSSFMGLKKRDPFQWAFNRRLKRAFRQLREENIQHLIVDMQGNGGGIVANSAELLRYWMPRKFAIMEQEEMKRAARAELITRWNPLSALNFSLRYKTDARGGFASRSGRHQYHPYKQNAFKGKLYFLVNGASFSATTSVLAKTLDAGLGTFVGEASGSAYWGDFAGHFKTVTLPNSRIQVRIPLKKLTHSVTADRANGFTVEPDFTVERTYNDLMTNREYVLEYTMELIRQGVVANRPLKSRLLQAAR
ncbi:S41 family peptidase [Spirosoma sp. KUDC1026]|uniref:S41 family peptidase n=1 Tax=Spirosoma sp. KUDC1026 TaxID=2745947 RepID=UPI00159BDCC6|nr:S41 family peptidase [Spirosoma sp. KUDC1026]QKZ11581.1 PDZ domain-containing protein [Spirosoma sp. KUDC1026]